MTEETKRAIEIITPLAAELDIEIKATDHVLQMNGQKIGISANSTWATLMEMIGYIFLEEYDRSFRKVDIDFQELNETIRRYWISEDLAEKIFTEKIFS